VDLHAVPKKSSLRAFAEYASDPKEKVYELVELINKSLTINITHTLLLDPGASAVLVEPEGSR
jgi:hypothetical protein